MLDAEKFYAGISQGNMDEVRKLTQEALNSGEKAETILQEGLLPAMDRVGVQFKNNEIYIPEVLIASRAMSAGTGILKPILSKSKGPKAAKIIMGTVKGDLHDIGKNLVLMLLEGSGFDVVDLGVDVSAVKFVAAIKQHQPQVVGISALLTTTMQEMKNTIIAIQENGHGKQPKVIVGGAPVTAEYSKKIGADGYASDAASAVDCVKELLSIK
jgi:5-methyltetrahydrofolate--homocysteine methyltransferase